MAFARARALRSTSSTSRRAAALEARSGGQGRRRPGPRRDLPALPHPDRRALRRPRSDRLRPIPSSRRRSARPPTATRCGPASPTARSTSSRPTTSPTGSASRRRSPPRASRSTRSRTARRGSRRSSRSSGRRASRRAASARSARSTSCRRRRPACSGSSGRAPIEVGRDADLVLFDPAARRTLRARDLHHTSDYTPYEGFELSGAVRRVFVRGRAGDPRRRVRRPAWLRPVRRAGDQPPGVALPAPAVRVATRGAGRRRGSGTPGSRRRGRARRAGPWHRPGAVASRPPRAASSSSRIVR